MDNDKIKKNNRKKNNFSDIIKTPILPKKHFSQEFPTVIANQKGSTFFNNLSKEIEKIKKRNSKNESINIISKKNSKLDSKLNSQLDKRKSQNNNLGFVFA